ncbi:MAG: LysR family transcriptional regulator [Eubacteriaceae bacterium]|nr:LysR family transcriptional regulator [Eubacteriaceae bacterium]
MNVMHLKYAVEVSKTGSISKAAENLYMGQPNLSKAIKELEDDLGVQIFKRTARGVLPTKKGEEFLGYARMLVSQMEDLETMYHPGPDSKVSFSLSIPRASYITSAFTDFVSDIDPGKGFSLDYRETNTLKTIHRVIEGENEAGIIRYPLDHEAYFEQLIDRKTIASEPILDFSYLLLLSKDHPLAEKSSIDCADLNRYIEVVHGDVATPLVTSRQTIKTEPAGSHNRKTISIYERGSQFDILCNVKSAYMWVSPLPEYLLERYDLVQRKLAHSDKTYRDLLIYSKTCANSYPLKLFKKQLTETVDQIISKTYS